MEEKKISFTVQETNQILFALQEIPAKFSLGIIGFISKIVAKQHPELVQMPGEAKDGSGTSQANPENKG